MGPSGGVQHEAVGYLALRDFPDLFHPCLVDLRIHSLFLEPEDRLEFPHQVAPRAPPRRS